jgi:hypothetical protein
MFYNVLPSNLIPVVGTVSSKALSTERDVQLLPHRMSHKFANTNNEVPYRDMESEHGVAHGNHV